MAQLLGPAQRGEDRYLPVFAGVVGHAAEAHVANDCYLFLSASAERELLQQNSSIIFKGLACLTTIRNILNALRRHGR